MQSVRFVLRTVWPKLINPNDLSTPNQGPPYNLSLFGLPKANQSKKAVRTICLPYDLSADLDRSRYSDEPVQLLRAALLQLNNLEKTTVDTVYCKYGVGADGAVAKIGCAAQTIIVLHKPGG